MKNLLMTKSSDFNNRLCALCEFYFHATKLIRVEL